MISNSWKRAMAFLILPVLPACLDLPERSDRALKEGADTVSRRDSNIVTNPERGAWGNEVPWTIIEEWRVGEIEGERPELLFGELVNTGIGPDGEVAVIDFVAQEVKVFSASGRFVRSIGGPGQGPGEFDGPLSLAWDGAGRLWIADGWNRRYSVFGPDGELLKTFPRDLSVNRFAQDLIAVGSDLFLDEIGGSGGLKLVLVDTTATVLDTLVLAPPPERSTLPSSTVAAAGPNALREVGAFLPRLVWKATSDRSVWFANSNELRLIHVDFEGDTIQIIKTSHREYGLTSEDERQIRRDLGRVGLDRSELSLGRRVVRGILVMGDGHVLVLIEPPPDSPGSRGAVFDVFDPAGQFLGSMETDLQIAESRNRRAMALRGDTLFAIITADLGVQKIVRATILRSEN